MEAWMCHSDQKLHDQVMKHGKAGFWPQPGQAFVGGSYILFEDSVMAEHKLLSPQDDKVRLSASVFFLCYYFLSFPLLSCFGEFGVEPPFVWAIKKTGIGYPTNG